MAAITELLVLAKRSIEKSKGEIQKTENLLRSSLEQSLERKRIEQEEAISDEIIQPLLLKVLLENKIEYVIRTGVPEEENIITAGRLAELLNAELLDLGLDKRLTVLNIINLMWSTIFSPTFTDVGEYHHAWKFDLKGMTKISENVPEQWLKKFRDFN